MKSNPPKTSRSPKPSVFVFSTRRKWSNLLGVFSCKEKALAFWNSLSPAMRQCSDSYEVMVKYPFVAVEYQDFQNGVNSFDFLPFDSFEDPEGSIFFEVYHFDRDWNSTQGDLLPCDSGILE